MFFQPMKKILFILTIMFSGLFGCALASPPPKGALIYCSYSRTGAAGLGKDYCELITDTDSVPKVVVALNVGNRFEDPEIHATFEVDSAVVDSLRQKLHDAKVHELAGYSLEESITGGHSYRIYMEYASGEKINARWYGSKVKDSAVRAYNLIENYFRPWREKAESQARIDNIVLMEECYDRVQAAVKSRKAYPTIEEDVEALRRYMYSGQWQRDYEADERGEIPSDLKRGVLSQDGLYDLLEGGRIPKP